MVTNKSKPRRLGVKLEIRAYELRCKRLGLPVVFFSFTNIHTIFVHKRVKAVPLPYTYIYYIIIIIYIYNIYIYIYIIYTCSNDIFSGLYFKIH